MTQNAGDAAPAIPARTPNEWADHYRYVWGINCVPSNGCQMHKGKVIPKHALPEPWQEWTKSPIPQDMHDRWKREGRFDLGIMRITGPAWHRDPSLTYCSVDMDDAAAVSWLLPDPQEQSKKHALETHGESGLYHWEFFTKGDSRLQPRAASQSGLAIEVKIGNGVMFGAPSLHVDGTQYRFLGLDIPGIMNGNKIQDKMDTMPGIVKSKKSVADLLMSVTPKGHNRSESILRFVDSIAARTSDLHLDDGFFRTVAAWFASSYTEPGYGAKRIDGIAEQAVKYVKAGQDAQRDASYQEMTSAGSGDSPVSCAIWLVKYAVSRLGMVRKSEITSELGRWKDIRKEGKKELDEAIQAALADDFVRDLRQNMCAEYGRRKMSITLDRKQYGEAAAYLIARHDVSRRGATGGLSHFDGFCHSIHTTQFLAAKIERLLPEVTRSDVSEVMAKIAAICPVIYARDIMAKSHMVCMQNGTYDIRAGKFHEGRFESSDLCQDMLPHQYGPGPHPEIRKFLNAMMDTDDITFLEDFIATCLYPYNGIDFQLGLLGPAGTGKSQIIKLVQNMFGEDMVHFSTIHDLTSDPTTRIRAASGRLLVDGDMHSTGVQQISALKRFISQEGFTDRAIYEQPERYYPRSRVMFSANTLYEIIDKNDAEAIYDRTHIIQAESRKRHTKEEIKGYVNIKVPKEEYGRCLSHILRIAHTMATTGTTRLPLDYKRTMRIWDALGNRIRLFSAHFIIQNKTDRTPASEVLSRWEWWQDQMGHTQDITRNEFYRDFAKINRVTLRKILSDGVSVWGYMGISVRNTIDVNLNEDITATTP